MRATDACGTPSYTMCSYTSSESSSTFVGSRISASFCMSSACQTVPVGLCGVLSMIRRVRGVMAAASVSNGMRKSGAFSVIGTTLPPASSIDGM